MQTNVTNVLRTWTSASTVRLVVRNLTCKFLKVSNKVAWKWCINAQSVYCVDELLMFEISYIPSFIQIKPVM